MVSNLEDGGSDNAPLTGGKGSVAEGGARVPAAIWWPGQLEGGIHDGFMTISDVLPTILEAVSGRDSIPAGLDGRSQWAVLSGKGASPTPDYLISGMDGVAIYRAPWKLLPGDEPVLLDVCADPLEKVNVAGAHPELVKSLFVRAESWPRGNRDGASALGFLWDPDGFGGPEDRAPWADVARENARAGD